MGTTPTAQMEQSRSGQMDPARIEPPTAEKALVPASEAAEAKTMVPRDSAVSGLPVTVNVAIPLRGFRLRDLLALAPGVLVESEWEHGGDLPLACGEVQLAWTEFEVIDVQLAARLTRLA